MVMTRSGIRLPGPWLLGIAIALLLAGCTQAPTPTPVSTPTLKANLLVQFDKDNLRWFRDVAVPKGTDAYEFTELVTKGDLKAKWYPAFRSHFVEAVLGVENKGASYWLLFLWDDGQKKWEPLPVGADLFSLKEGHVLAWAYSDTSQSPAPLPVATP